jgi:hypothetical protein
VLPKLSNVNARLPQEVDGTPVDWGLDAQTLQRLAAVVLESIALPAETWNDVSDEYQRYAMKIDDRNRQSRWDVQKCVLDFNRFYGDRFLDKVGLHLSSVGSDSWPARLAHGARPSPLFQLRHILLRLFLKFCLVGGIRGWF